MSARGLFDLSGRVALVTGSSRGIGQAIARGLAEAGATVVLNGRNRQALDATYGELRGDGLDVRAHAFDASHRAQVDQAVAAIEADVGPIDILVNNAGIQRRGAFETFPEETWAEIFDTNVHAVFHVTQAVGARMVARKRGRIIMICSVTSDLGRATIVPYAATKGAVRQMVRGLCAEWAKYDIQVNGIAPGYFKTELNEALMADEAFSGVGAFADARRPLGRNPRTRRRGCVPRLRCRDFVNGHLLFVDGGLSVTV